MNVIVPMTEAEQALGFQLPSRRLEDWKWTDLRRLIARPYPLVPETASARDIDRLVKSSPFSAVTAKRVVVVNGILDGARSQLEGLQLSPAVPLCERDEPVALLNKTQKATGFTLTLGGTVDTPIEIIHVATAGKPRSIATRNHIEVAAGASATLIETFLGEGDYLTNAVVGIRMGDGARLDRVKAETESHAATHLSHVVVSLANTAILRDFTLTSGAGLNRQNGTYEFQGRGADARIAGAYLLNGRQHADTRLVVDHKVPHCVSREVFKCVMDDHARGIFQGKVIVRPDAQKTDGKQSSHGLLLSETAEFDAKPELEIYADDVVCGHGATSGDLNHDHMFYLRSRGISEAEAKSLLIAAFAGEAFDAVQHEGIRDALTGFVGGWLTTRKV